MKKTCYNCAYFHSTLNERDESDFYHVHEYCESWNCCLQKDMESEVNAFLKEFWGDLDWGDADCVSNDFETGEACCWRYRASSRKTPPFSDDFFERNKERNKQLALRSLNKLIETNRYHSLTTGDYIDIYPGDLERFKQLRDKLLEEK